MSADVVLTTGHGVATVALDRPPRNAITPALADRLADVLRRCDADPDVRAVVLTGAGTSFSAGADLTDGPDWAAQLLARTSPAAVARTRRLLNAAPATAAAASAAESAALVELAGGPDCPGGIAAFLQRRPPRFSPRPAPAPGHAG
jgi:enoyl-CoA hydratase/carnithine racemase